MRKYFSVTIFLSLFFIFPFGKKGSGLALAQSYPIQLTTQLLPPYSGYLPDYATAGNEKLHLILLLKDLSKPVYALRLSVKIEGQGFVLQSKPFFKGTLVNLDPGLPTELSADVLAQLLDSKNLDFSGIDKADYEQRKVLPEGYYKICFTAYDYYNPLNIQVSNESCASAWMTLSDPPRLNLPLCGSTLSTGTPQQITFSWMPMNMGSPNSAQNTEYVFELWEIRPEGAEPNNIVQTLPPVFSLSTSFTTLNYGLAETPLNPGMEYAWRVRATDKNGYDNFKNKGYSEVCSFRYGNKYESMGDALKLNLQAIPLSARMAKLQWDSLAIYTQYLVNYRKQGKGEWFESSTNTGSLKVYDLEPQMAYEARVQGTTVDGYIGPWSNTVVFQTPAPAQYACGDLPASTPEQNVKPLLSVFAGIIIQVGQFEMRATQIQGSNGYYSGLGRIKVPFAATDLNVAYDNIYVNEDRQLLIGEVKAISEGVENWMFDKAVKEAEEKAVYIEDKIDSVTIINDKVCLFTNGNKTPETCVDKPKPGEALVIRSGDGTQYIISPDGTVTKTSYIKPSSDQLEASDSLNIVFKASTTKKYGFDEKQYAARANEYEAIVLPNKKNYFVPLIGIAEGQSDEAAVEINIKNVEAGKLKFKTQSGQDIVLQNNAGKQTITVPAEAQSVYAYYNNSKIGKLNVISLKPISRKLVIVPVNGAAAPTNLQDNINTIYRQANVTWSVSTAPNLNINYDSNNNGLDVADATLMNKYSEEMRVIRDAFRKDSSYDKSAYYLFVVNSFSDKSTQGYMVRGRAVGFVSRPNSGGDDQAIRTIAHELAHGTFGLEHSFPQTTQGTTDNLMDYGTGTALNATQWTRIHSKVPVFNWTDQEEDAAYRDLRKQLLELLTETKNACRTNAAIDMSGKYNSYMSADTTYINGIKYDGLYIKILSQYGTVISPKNNITETTYAFGGNPKKCLDIEGRVKIFAWPESKLINLKIYLENTLPTKNLLLFVNGYRIDEQAWIPVVELPDTKNELYQTDVLNYWSGIDAQFMNRIGTKNVVYADGHHSITTSNHKSGGVTSSQLNFLDSYNSSKNANRTIDQMKAEGRLDMYNYKDLNYNSFPDRCYHNNSCVHLNTSPNTAGFNTRVVNGMKAANLLLEKINEGKVVFNKNTDTLDIVCHSMGFAYAQGMIEIFKIAKIKLGRYYILAPENGGSGSINLNDFDQVWQYGSNLGMAGQDDMWEQDGVAPQAAIFGLPSDNRVAIPPNPGFAKAFDNCHYVKNYGWIFNTIKNGQKGYIKKRN
ncbi:MAG: fibronectin type III domain-containing protein [Bacteroidia bacterium]|nr:fibronectin type III domain-containing protein [Bacteroidia bacterium]